MTPHRGRSVLQLRGRGRLGQSTAAAVLASAVIAVVLFAAVAQPTAVASSSPPTRKIVLTPLPDQLPTNSSGRSAFPALVLSMTDLQGNLLISPNRTTFYLSSSQTAVLSVPPTVTILPGEQYVVANVTTTATPGSSVVTAVAPGFESASVTISTVIARGYPTGLDIYPLPGVLPAGPSSVARYGVEVVDAAGLPARTIQDTVVNVTSSDTAVLYATQAEIPANQSVGYFTVNVNGAIGSAEITASAPGLVSDSKVITVTTVNGLGTQLQMSSSAVSLPADGKTYNLLTVQLADNKSEPVVTDTPVQVFLTSSRPDIATTPPEVTIPAGSSFVVIPVTTSPASGTAIITATATNYVSSSVTVDTVSIPPAQLGVYISDSNALISASSKSLQMAVQLQASSGLPAEARAPVSVIVSFSNSTFSQSPLSLTIPKGADLIYDNISISGATRGTFTAISNGLLSASVSFSATPLKVTGFLNPSSPSVTLGGSTTLTFTLQAQGSPVAGATVTWTSKDGRFSNSTSTTSTAGTASVAFDPSATGYALVTASATDPVTGTVNASYYITVLSPTPPRHQTLESKLLSYPYILMLAGAAAAAVVAVSLLMLRRRRRSAEAEGALSEEDQVFNLLRPQVPSGPLGRLT